jgi:uncharacterized protein YndB with AHSA1/START domain
MSTTRIVIRAPAEAVFDTLTDAECYPRWVVGASHIRDVDAEWPTDGSSFHHSVGVWPVRIHDSTTIVRSSRPRSVELRARAWPLGEADVRIELEQRGGLTRVTMRETAAEGPGAAIWSAPTSAITTARNRVSLRRLKELVESRAPAAAT